MIRPDTPEPFAASEPLDAAADPSQTGAVSAAAGAPADVPVPDEAVTGTGASADAHPADGMDAVDAIDGMDAVDGIDGMDALDAEGGISGDAGADLEHGGTGLSVDQYPSGGRPERSRPRVTVSFDQDGMNPGSAGTDAAITGDDAGDDLNTIIEALIFAADEPLPFKQIRDLLYPGDDGDAGESGSDGVTPLNGAAGEAAMPDMAHEGDAETSDTTVDVPEETGEEGDPHTRPQAARGRGKARRSFTVNALAARIDTLNAHYASTGRAFRIVEIAGGYTFQTTASVGAYVGRMFVERTKRRLTQSALETLAIIAFKQPISKPGIEAIRGVNADYVLKSLLEKNLIAIVGRDNSVGRPLLYGTTRAFLKHFGLNSLEDLPRPREIQDLLAEDDELAARSIEERDDTIADGSASGESIFDTPAASRSGIDDGREGPVHWSDDPGIPPDPSLIPGSGEDMVVLERHHGTVEDGASADADDLVTGTIELVDEHSPATRSPAAAGTSVPAHDAAEHIHEASPSAIPEITAMDIEDVVELDIDDTPDQLTHDTRPGLAAAGPFDDEYEDDFEDDEDFDDLPDDLDDLDEELDGEDADEDDEDDYDDDEEDEAFDDEEKGREARSA